MKKDNIGKNMKKVNNRIAVHVYLIFAFFVSIYTVGFLIFNQKEEFLACLGFTSVLLLLAVASSRRCLWFGDNKLIYKNIFGITKEYKLTDIKKCYQRYSFGTDAGDYSKTIVIIMKSFKIIWISDTSDNYFELKEYLTKNVKTK